jgi:hypothetical protein
MNVIHQRGYRNAKIRMESIVRLKPDGKIVEFAQVVLNRDVLFCFSSDQQRCFIQPDVSVWLGRQPREPVPDFVIH